MNPNTCRIALRPRDPLEVFDLTIRFVHEHFRVLGRLTLLTAGPIWFLGAVAAWFFQGHWAILLIPLLAAAPLQAPFTVLTGRLLFSDDVAIRDVFVALRGRLGALIGVWALSFFGLVLGAITCFYALPFVQGGLLYLSEAALLERVPASRAFRRSMRLAGGHLVVALAGAVGRLFLTVWCALVAEFSGQAIVSSMLMLGTPFGSLLEGEITPFLLAGLLVAQPLSAVYRLLLYVDVRTRIEGWDLQVGLRAAGLGT